MKTYLVLGYGIPKKLEVDANYRTYLGIVFNTIFSQSQISKELATMIFCGGLTDMFKPYKRTEAQEMLRLFRLFADRSVCRDVTKSWQYVLEKKSLSTLENLVYAKQILDGKKLNATSLTIFCEATREKRIKRLAKKIFGNANVVAIDFDLSENRYLDPAFIEKRERATVELDDWAMKNPENMKEFRKLFLEKFAFLRKAGPGNHQVALREWWHKRLDALNSTPRQAR